MRRTRRALFMLVGLVLAGVVAGQAVESAAQAPDQLTGIRVRGQGVLTVSPDVAVLNVGASVRRDTPGAALDTLTARVDALLASLRSSGVAERDIRTQGLSLFQESQPRPVASGQPAPIEVAWRARQSFSVKLRDFARISSTLETALTALGDGAELQGVFFQIEDTNPLTDRARDLAVADAKDRAEKLAAQFGVRVGRLISVQEISTPQVTPVVPVPQPTARPATPVPAPPGLAPLPFQVSPGEQTISVIIDAVFAIE